VLRFTGWSEEAAVRSVLMEGQALTDMIREIPNVQFNGTIPDL